MCAGERLRLAGYRPARAWVCAGAGRRGVSAFLREHIGFAMLSAGSPLGAEMWKPHCGRPQTCAKESSTLWTLLRGWTSGKVRFARRGWGGADSRRRHPGTRKDLTGSDLWPVRSGCIAMLSTRSIVQTRAAPKRRGVGLQRAKRSACRLSLPTLRDCKIKVT